MSAGDISLRYILFGEDKTATSTIGKVGGAFGKLGRYVGGEFGEILDRVGDGIDNIGEHAHSMGAKITGVGAVVGGLGVALQMAGSREKQGAAQLNAAIDATGKAHEDYAEDVEKAIKGNERFGFGAADTQQALAKMTAATNDPAKALANMGITANLAASQHISLADASKMVNRILGGSGGRTLAQYGITMDKTKSKTEAGQIALDQLAGKLKGQASASVDSFGGKIKVLQTRVGDFTAQMGQKFGPALTVAGPLLMGVGTILELYKTRQLAAAAATNTETAAESRGIITKSLGFVRTVAVTAATGAWTAAQWALNVALNANPIALVIIGIIALIAIIVVAWKHSETFRNIVTGAFHAVLHAATATWAWIKGNWPLLLAILTGPFGLAVLWVTRHWNGIITFFKGVPGKIGAALASANSAITWPFRTAFNLIADAWNNTVGRLHWSIPSWVPGIGGDSISAPQLPHFARGVRGFTGGLAVVGEHGSEVVHLPRGSDVFPHGSSGGAGTVVEYHYHIELPVTTADYPRAGRELIRALKAAQQTDRSPIDIRVSRAAAVG